MSGLRKVFKPPQLRNFQEKKKVAPQNLYRCHEYQVKPREEGIVAGLGYHVSVKVVHVGLDRFGVRVGTVFAMVLQGLVCRTVRAVPLKEPSHGRGADNSKQILSSILA